MATSDSVKCYLLDEGCNTWLDQAWERERERERAREREIFCGRWVGKLKSKNGGIWEREREMVGNRWKNEKGGNGTYWLNNV